MLLKIDYYFLLFFFFFFFFGERERESFNLWRQFLNIALYDQTKTPIGFLV